MQNFLAVLFFGLLVATVFWPDDLIRKNTVNEMERARVQHHKDGAEPTTAGMVYHYLGVQNSNNNEE